MGWGSLIGVMIAAFVLLSVPVGAVQDGWTQARCVNKTHLYLWDDIGLSGRSLRGNTTLDCSPYDCNNLSETCNNPYQMNKAQSDFSLYIYLFMFFSGVAALFYGIAGQKKHVLLTIWSTIMFGVMSMQSIALDAVFTGTFFAGFTPVLVGLSLLLMLVSLVATFVGMFKMMQKKPEKEGLGSNG